MLRKIQIKNTLKGRLLSSMTNPSISWIRRDNLLFLCFEHIKLFLGLPFRLFKSVFSDQFGAETNEQPTCSFSSEFVISAGWTGSNQANISYISLLNLNPCITFKTNTSFSLWNIHPSFFDAKHDMQNYFEISVQLLLGENCSCCTIRKVCAEHCSSFRYGKSWLSIKPSN